MKTPVVARAAAMLTPGAVIVGWYSESPGIPRDEESASVVPSFAPAATQITHGATQYGFRVFSAGPEFPAAKTTTRPASCAILLATLRGSSAEKEPVVPQLFEMTRIPYRARLAKIQSKPSSALRTKRTSPAPTPTRLAPMATPRYFPASAAPVPAAIEETWVPWPLVVSVLAMPSTTIAPMPIRLGTIFTF